MQVGPGDKLFAYVYLDPANPPAEIMLQWNVEKWEHRAYWGAIRSRGGRTPRTAGDTWAGCRLLASGSRLEVPASQVGLEGKAVNGLAFTVFNGRATWDRAGRSGVSGSSTTAPSGSAPVIAITSPAQGDRFTAPANITISAAAAPSDAAISKVEFYEGVIKLGESTQAPFAFTWNNVPAGSYSLSVKATDNSGSVATSPATGVAVDVPQAVPLSVALTLPTASALFSAPANIDIHAAASGTGIARVEFYANGQKVGEATGNPYSVIWSNVGPGTYVISAKVTDITGASATSADVYCTVQATDVLWTERILNEDGTLNRAEYVNLANTYDTVSAADYRFGPRWENFHPGDSGSAPTVWGRTVNFRRANC